VRASLPVMGRPLHTFYNDVVYAPGGWAHGTYHMLCPEVSGCMQAGATPLEQLTPSRDAPVLGAFVQARVLVSLFHARASQQQERAWC
jgi:hypothetical protein